MKLLLILLALTWVVQSKLALDKNELVKLFPNHEPLLIYSDYSPQE